ncbi:MAG: site-specific integrase [Firmicutes bacterium]|nr:site-specific integrase [Bacillota bacterium]
MAKKKVVTVKKKKTLPEKENWEEAFQGFLLWKQAQGLSETTLDDYKKHVNLFFKRHPKAFGPKNLKAAIYVYMSEQIKPATYNLRLAYLRAFFNWCVEEGFLTENPLAKFKRRKAEGRIVNVEEESLKRLIQLPDKEAFAGLRDYALMLLTLDTGIRPKEAFSLLSEDINIRSLEVHIRSEESKTRSSRTLPIGPVTAKAIQELISSRHPDWRQKVPVFCSCEGTPLNRHTWGKRLEMYSKMLGVHIRPYDLRHAFALQYLRNGGHALALQRMMGHTDLTMTKRYVALTQGDLREQHLLASPLNNLAPQKKRVRRAKAK